MNVPTKQSSTVRETEETHH